MIKTIVYIAVFYFLWQTGLLSFMLGTVAAFFAWAAMLTAGY